MARGLCQLSLLLVLLLAVMSVCEARKKHRRVKVQAITLWTKWDCVTGGLQLERSRKVKATGRCPRGHGLCHKIQHQYKAANGKCGKCAVDTTDAILTSTTSAALEADFYVMTSGFVADGIATIGNNVYVLCHNDTLGPPYEYQINVYNASANYNLTQTFPTPSGGDLLGLTACKSKGSLYFTDIINYVTYGMDAKTGAINWQSKRTPFYYTDPTYYYDDITEDLGCNIAVTTLGKTIWGFAKDGGARAVNLSNSGVVDFTNAVSPVLGCYVVSFRVIDNGPWLVSLFNAFGKIVANSTGVTFQFPTSVITNGGYVLVVDNGAKNVTLLNSQMVFQKTLVTGIASRSHMWLDVHNRRLYLASRSDGSVVVYSLTG